MDMQNSGTAVLAPVDEDKKSTVGVFAPLSQWAELEFQATLRLLAERARFLTAASNVAIALQEQDRLLYAAVCGDDAAPQPGAPVDLSKSQISECVKNLNPVRREIAGPSPYAMVVPIVRESKFAGCFELIGLLKFEDADLEQISRLAQLASTAIEYRDGAMKAARQEFEDVLYPQPAPSLWHAPESVEKRPAQPEAAAATSAADVRSCASCGFPVSGRRALCLECEQKADVAHPVPEVLTTPSHESWISAHGYTLVSLLMTALVIAMILWLRH